MLSFNELEEEIISVCENHREIIAAYVFGSRAMGKYKRGSDVDIALLLNDREARDFQYLEFKVKLERALNINVDLIILNNAGEILKHQIRKNGKIIFERNSKMRKQWEVLSRKLFQDFLYLHRIYMKKLYAHYGVENG
jgi:predicted nucleotidyltransferase